MENAKRNAGLTLIKPLVVICIVGLIFVICLPFIHKTESEQKAENSAAPPSPISACEYGSKAYQRFEDIPFLKCEYFLTVVDCCEGGAYWAVVPHDLNIEPYFILVSSECEDKIYEKLRSYPSLGPPRYSEYDSMLGRVPRGTVLGKQYVIWERHGESSRLLNDWHIVDVELESGERKRIRVCKEFFNKICAGDQWPLDKTADIVNVNKEKLAQSRGWSVRLHSFINGHQCQSLYYFVPIDGSKPYFYETNRDYDTCRIFHGDLEPLIQEDFGPVPKGKVIKKEDFDENYFLIIENDLKIQRYRAHRTFYNLVKTGDILPLQKNTNPR